MTFAKKVAKASVPIVDIITLAATGCADAMNHIMEQYFCEDSTLLNDGFMEAGLKSLMVNAMKCLENLEDYTARAEMMMTCTYGCNGIYSLGNSQTGWPLHGMEHALAEKDIADIFRASL